MIITIRTEKPESEVGLFTPAGEQIDYVVWEAHRSLSETIFKVISDILQKNGMTHNQLTGVIFYKGPGSFTGLRIGASLANALALSLNLILANTSGPNWVDEGVARISAGKTELALPQYGAGPHITLQKK